MHSTECIFIVYRIFGGQMIRIKCYSVASKVLIVFFALLGISLQTGIWDGDFDIRIFRMFTNLSNLMCATYFTIAASVIGFDKNRNGGSSPFPIIKGICTMSITLTGIVAAAVIASEFNIHTSNGIATVLLHIVTPVLIMADWLLFDTKGRWRSTAPLWWLIAPMVYFVYIMISAYNMDSSVSNRFPYPFLDYEILGIPMLILVISVITAFYLVIGYLCFFIDRKMGFLEEETYSDLNTAKS